MKAGSGWKKRALICLALGCFASPAYAVSPGEKTMETPVMSEEGEQALEEAEEAISEKEGGQGSAENEEAVPETDQAGEQAEWTGKMAVDR